MLDSNIIFYLFSILLIFCALMVTVVKHPVFSLLFLVASFIFSAFMLFMLECEFLAFLFIVVYVGAVAILFLFAIMMLETKLNDLSKNVMKYLPVGFFFGLVLLVPLMLEMSSNFNTGTIYNSFYFLQIPNFYTLAGATSDVEVYGQVLYSYFVLQFLVAGLILLVVLVGVVYLTNNYNVKKQRLDQAVFKQLARESKFFFN
jgi:NADH-quinone oxidoreductase subunit J